MTVERIYTVMDTIQSNGFTNLSKVRKLALAKLQEDYASQHI
jgi:hypothetical protein